MSTLIIEQLGRIEENPEITTYQKGGCEYFRYIPNTTAAQDFCFYFKPNMRMVATDRYIKILTKSIDRFMKRCDHTGPESLEAAAIAYALQIGNPPKGVVRYCPAPQCRYKTHNTSIRDEQ